MKNIFLLLISLFVLSCSNLVLETESIEVDAIVEGQVLTTGEYFDISFNKTSESVVVLPTTADMSIEYVSDTRSPDIYDDSIEPVELVIDIEETPNPEFQITSDFKEGIYKLNIVVYEDESVITEYDSEFMVYSGILSGEVSNLHPQKNIYTDSKIILESDIVHSDYIDPYLIWSFNGEIITQGSLSDGYNSIIWDTEQMYGFMDVHLNLYPYKPSDVTVDSDSSVDFSFVVNPLDSDLYDAELLAHYSKLLYFNGNYIDEIDRYLDIELLNDSEPAVYNEFFGMKIGSEIGFSTEDSVMPVDSDSGELQSFSIITNLMPLELGDGDIFYNSHGELFSKIYVEDGDLYFSYGDETSSEEVDIIGLESGESIRLVLSFIKKEDGYSILYYVNGSFIDDSFWDVPSGFYTDDFRFTLGDYSSSSIEDINVDSDSESDLELESDSYIGTSVEDDIESDTELDSEILSVILDEFSVYYIDDYGNNNIYSHILSDLLGRGSYRLVEGFNTVYTPLNLYGTGSVDGEFLTMDAESVLTYLDILPIDTDYDFTIECEGSYILNFYEDENNLIFRTLSDSSLIKKRGDILFINDEVVEAWDSSRNSFSITSLDEVVIDSIVIDSLEKAFENN